MGFNSQPVPVSDEQIQGVKTLVFSTLEFDPYPYLTVSDRVEILRGPLRGLRGVLLEKKNRYKFILSVDLIQQSVACEIDAADVEKV